MSFGWISSKSLLVKSNHQIGVRYSREQDNANPVVPFVLVRFQYCHQDDGKDHDVAGKAEVRESIKDNHSRDMYNA